MSIRLVFGIATRKPHGTAVAFEREDVSRNTVEKPTVVADYYDAPRELDECILKSAQCVNVQIVRWFIKEQ